MKCSNKKGGRGALFLLLLLLVSATLQGEREEERMNVAYLQIYLVSGSEGTIE